MEYGHPIAPIRAAVLDHNPQRPLYDDPAAGAGSVPQGGEKHHEKTPVLKKVKNKVKKLKDAITKKRNAHDDVHEVYVEEEGEEEDGEDMEVDLEVHSSPNYQSGNTHLGTAEHEGVTLQTGPDFSGFSGTGGNIPYEHFGGNVTQGVTFRTGPDYSGFSGTGGNIPYEHPVGGNIPYEHPGVPLRTGRDVSGALGAVGNIPYEHSGVPLRTGEDVSGGLGTGEDVSGGLGTGEDVSGGLGTGGDVSGGFGTSGNIPYEHSGVPLRTGQDVSGGLGTGGDVSGGFGTGGNIPYEHVGRNVPYEHQQHVPLRTGRDFSRVSGTGGNIPYGNTGALGTGRDVSDALGTGRDVSGALRTGRGFSGDRDERLSLETVMVTTLEEDPAAPLPYSSIPLTTGIQINRPTQAGNARGNELDVSPDVLSALETMAISAKRDDQDQLAQPSDVEQKQPGYTEKLSSTATAAKDAAVSAASTLYSTVAGTQSTGTKMETMPAREDKIPSYAEKLSSTAAAAKDAALSASSTVYDKVAGKDEHDQVSTGSRMVGRDREGAGEEKGGREDKVPSYTEKLSSTAAAAKDAALSAASTVYDKVAGKDEHDQVSTGSRMVGRDREGAGEEKGGYTEKLSETALAAKDAAVSAASTVYGKVAGAGTAVMEKVQPGGGTEPSMTDYLSEKLRPGEEDRALSEVISETMQKRGEEDRVIVEKKRVVLPELTSRDGVTNRDVVEEERVVLPWVTGRKGEVSGGAYGGLPGVTRQKGEVSGGAHGGKGMMEKIRETITSVVGGGDGASDAPPPVAAPPPTAGMDY